MRNTIPTMRVSGTASVFVLLCGLTLAQQKPSPRPVTVPATVDHNRVVVDGELALPGGMTQAVHVWVDNGNPDLYLSRRIATLLNLAVTCGDQECSAPPPPGIRVGGLSIPFTDIKQAKIPLKPVTAAAVLASGMNADINLPAAVLRHYDVLIDFPGRKFTIGAPGTIHFQGASGRVEITQNGLIQVPSKIENKKYNLALDLGSCISFLSDEVFGALAKAHPDWPHLTGAVGSANMWGAPDETKWQVMRADRVQYGPLYLTDVAMVALPKAIVDFFEKRAGMPTAGLLGSNILINYRVGLDYAHSMVYFDIGRLFRFPDFTVVGLVLGPQDDGRYTVLGVPQVDGKPAVGGVQAGDDLVAVDDIPVKGSTMGQVWAMLGGSPGQERRLTLERAGRQFVVQATVRNFLPEAPESGKERGRYLR